MLGLAACSPTHDQSEPVASEIPHFTVRGRLKHAQLRVALDSEDAPVSASVFERAAREACRLWTDTGLITVEFRESGGGDLTISFERGVHGPCTPFGRDTTIAHTGPCGPANFLHLDGEREWSADLLQRTLAHEIGHALGLGHSADPSSLMFEDESRSRRVPTASDLAGLASLYGGGTDSDADLALYLTACSEERERVTTLRAIAPRDKTAFAGFDADGDGADDLLVWRTDEPGHGELTVWFFDTAGRITHTRGPLIGMCPAGMSMHFGVTEDGERLLVRVAENGRAHAVRFDDFGVPQPRPGPAFVLNALADADGNWQLDGPLPAIEPGPCGSEWVLLGDLDGEGEADGARRVTAAESQ